MITETGKSIIAKYLIGQAPAYASYIAIGCGAKPVATAASLGDYSGQSSLEFEMLRVPITSRGYVNEGDGPKIVFTAELPSEERYEITEVGVYSAGSNSSAGYYGSKTIQAFNNEAWAFHYFQNSEPAGSNTIETIYEPLDGDLKDNSINTVNGPVSDATIAFRTNADNRIFADTNRITRFERCRFFNNMILMAGNSSIITADQITGKLSAEAQSHIELVGTSLDLTRNALSDELRLAFSVISKEPDGAAPDNVRLIIEFSSSDNFGEGDYARFEVNLDNGTLPDEWDFDTNRYVVAKKKLSELTKSGGFAWDRVNTIKVYASASKLTLGTLVPSSDFYIALDALRIENVTSINPLYGLTGYTVIANSDSSNHAATIVKAANTTSFVEFRFAMDVQVG